MKPNRLTLSNIAQIRHADVRFGDLNVFVGPQATGKSIFLQFLKLVIDARSILSEFKRYNIDWKAKPGDFLELYFGEGMSSIWSECDSAIEVDGQEVTLQSLTTRGHKSARERLFFIPAQRVMSVRDGLTRPFTDYRAGDPFVLRAFSERLHHLVQSEFGTKSELFPQKQRLTAELRGQIARHIFGGFGLQIDKEGFQKRVALSHPETGRSLPYLVWSAGQREFVPLLLGFYWLMPSSRISRRDHLEWVAIEELEMGLHPDAISAVLTLVLELIHRGYRVCLSTHSPHVLDVIWALRKIADYGGDEHDLLDLFQLKTTGVTKQWANSALKADCRVYFFTREGEVRDISPLDPGSEDVAEAGWGGLTGFSGRVGDVVARVVNRAG